MPRGFAQGFVVLSEEATFAYKGDNYYSPECDRELAFVVASLRINWQLQANQLQLSPKDTKQPLLVDAEYFEYDMEICIIF